MSFWGTLGKIGSAVAAPFTGGLSLYGIPAIGAIEGAKKGGWKGALTGGAIGAGEMLLPGAVSKIPGVSNVISKVGGSKIGSFLGGGSSAAGAGSGASSSFIGDAVSNTAKQAAGGGSWLSNAGKQLMGLVGGGGAQGTGTASGGGANTWATAGKGLEALANDEAANRLAKGNFTQNYDQLMMKSQDVRNQNEGDALKKLAISNYLAQKNSGYAPATIQMNGMERKLPNFGTGHFAPSAAQKTGASTLEAQLLDRLKPGGSYAPQDLEGYANPGKLENVGKFGALATTGLNVWDQILKNRQKPEQQIGTPPFVGPTQ